MYLHTVPHFHVLPICVRYFGKTYLLITTSDVVLVSLLLGLRVGRLVGYISLNIYCLSSSTTAA